LRQIGPGGDRGIGRRGSESGEEFAHLRYRFSVYDFRFREKRLIALGPFFEGGTSDTNYTSNIEY
jgi:hypothetical protein